LHRELAQGYVPLVETCLLLVCVLLSALHPSPQSSTSIEQRIQQLVRLNGKGTDAALRRQLVAMGKLDQQVRKPFETMFSRAAKPTEAEVRAVTDRVDRTDRQLTAQLMTIVARYGWPTIHLVGLDASSSATIILVHSPDHDFQRRLLPQLETLVAEDKIVGSDVAVLIDKLLQADGKLQRFGTVFHVGNGEAILDPIEDPAHVDERRAKYLLPSIDEFKQSFAAAFHVTAK